jgi:hypothetical protein
MKRTLFAALTIFTAALSHQAFAEDEFAAHKTEILAEIDGRIQKMQEHKSCVSAATNKEALMACRSTMKAWRESEHAQHAEKAKGRIDEKIKKLQDRKNKIQ